MTTILPDLSYINEVIKHSNIENVRIFEFLQDLENRNSINFFEYFPEYGYIYVHGIIKKWRYI